MTLNPTRSNVPHIKIYVTIYPQVPNFTSFRFATSHFQATGHFQTSDPNDYTLQGQRYTTCVTSITKSQISVCFARYKLVDTNSCFHHAPTLFELETILR